MDTKQVYKEYVRDFVLERCDFIWIQNPTPSLRATLRVLERCDFIWIQNKLHEDHAWFSVLERCDFIWIQNITL